MILFVRNSVAPYCIYHNNHRPPIWEHTIADAIKQYEKSYNNRKSVNKSYFDISLDEALSLGNNRIALYCEIDDTVTEDTLMQLHPELFI